MIKAGGPVRDRLPTKKNTTRAKEENEDLVGERRSGHGTEGERPCLLSAQVILIVQH